MLEALRSVKIVIDDAGANVSTWGEGVNTEGADDGTNTPG